MKDYGMHPDDLLDARPYVPGMIYIEGDLRRALRGWDGDALDELALLMQDTLEDGANDGDDYTMALADAVITAAINEIDRSHTPSWLRGGR